MFFFILSCFGSEENITIESNDFEKQDNYIFEKELFEAKDTLYRDHFFLQELRDINVEKNLYSPKRMQDLFIFMK